MTDLMLGQWDSLPKEELRKRLVEEENKLFGPHRPPQAIVEHRPAFLSLHARLASLLKSISALPRRMRPYFHPSSLFSRPQ
jgi:hypothetical protein